MCVLHENAFPRRLPTTEELLFELFPLEPGAIVRLDRGANLLLLDCGDGDLLCQLSGMFPRSLFAGLDSSATKIARARQVARESDRRNIWFEPGDSPRLFRCQFHLVLHIAASEAPVAPDFAALHASLYDGGTLFLRDDLGTATDGFHRAGFSSHRHIVLPNPALSHVYIARQ